MSVTLRQLIKYFLISVFTYVLFWFFSYVILMEFDFKYITTYFFLGWGGGEIPVLIQLTALSSSVVFLLLAFFLKKLRGPGKGSRGSD